MKFTAPPLCLEAVGHNLRRDMRGQIETKDVFMFNFTLPGSKLFPTYTAARKQGTILGKTSPSLVNFHSVSWERSPLSWLKYPLTSPALLTSMLTSNNTTHFHIPIIKKHITS